MLRLEVFPHREWMMLSWQREAERGLWAGAKIYLESRTLVTLKDEYIRFVTVESLDDAFEVGMGHMFDHINYHGEYLIEDEAVNYLDSRLNPPKFKVRFP